MEFIKSIVHREKIYDKVINVTYDYEVKGERLTGNGALIDADLEKALLFNKGFITILSESKINTLTPQRTNKQISFREIFFSEITLDSLQTLIKDKPLTSLSIRSNLPLEYSKDNRPQSSLSVELQNVFNPVIKGNSIDSVDANMQKEIIVAEEELNILKQQINNQSKTELIFQQEKAQALENLNNLQLDIKSEDLATRERATKELPGAKVKLQEYQNHITKDYNTLRIAEEKLRFLKSKEHIIKLQTISGFLEYFTIQ